MESFYWAAVVFCQDDLEHLIFAGDEEINPDTIIYVGGIQGEEKEKSDEEITAYLVDLCSKNLIPTKERGDLEFVDPGFGLAKIVYVRGPAASLKYRAASVFMGRRVVFYDWAAWDEYFEKQLEKIRHRKKQFRLEFYEAHTPVTVKKGWS